MKLGIVIQGPSIMSMHHTVFRITHENRADKRAIELRLSADDLDQAG